jgi:hypothetical protein
LSETELHEQPEQVMPPAALPIKKKQFEDLTLRLLFVVFMALNMLNNMDHGVLPAGSITIKEDLKMDNLQFGLIGSAVFAGLTRGKPPLYNLDKYRVDCGNFCLSKFGHKDGALCSAHLGGCLPGDVLLLIQLLCSLVD